MTDTETTGRSLLDAAGITCSEAEFDAFVAQYPGIQKQVEAWYAPAFADADPLLVLATDR